MTPSDLKGRARPLRGNRRGNPTPFGVRTTHPVVPVVCALVLAASAGCWQPPKITRAQQERGYILVLEGIDFNVWQMAGTYHGLRDAGIDAAIDVPDWGYRNVFNSGYRNLSDLPNNRRLCEQFARRIGDYLREYPGRPVDIIGYSGGGALAVMTAEALPPGVTLDRIILLGAALSPDYDLSTALSRCRRGIVNFYSSADCLVLGAGTKLYGTIDRRKTPAAGHVGFRVPQEARDIRGAGPPGEPRPAADTRPGRPRGDASTRPGGPQGGPYAKLTQIAWTPSMWRLGHDGGHFGWVARQWTAEVVAPWLKQPQAVPETRPTLP